MQFCALAKAQEINTKCCDILAQLTRSQTPSTPPGLCMNSFIEQFGLDEMNLAKIWTGSNFFPAFLLNIVYMLYGLACVTVAFDSKTFKEGYTRF